MNTLVNIIVNWSELQWYWNCLIIYSDEVPSYPDLISKAASIQFMLGFPTFLTENCQDFEGQSG